MTTVDVDAVVTALSGLLSYSFAAETATAADADANWYNRFFSSCLKGRL